MTQTYADYANNTNPRWWRDPGMRKGFFHIIILYTAVYSLGYDGALLSGLQALPTWNRDFNNPTGTSLGLIAATYYLPKIPLTFVVAYLVDRFGRKIPLYIGSVLMIAGAIAGGVAQTRAHLMGSRVLLGAGTAAAQITACALIPELAHPRLRHYAGSFLNTTYYVGSIFAAWLTFACIYYPNGSSNGWRVPTYVQGLGPVLLLAAWFVPESPRWLIKNGREEEAHRDLAKYHANGKMDDPLVLLEVREIKAAIEIEKIAGTGSWASWFKTAGNRRRFFIIIMLGTATQLSGNGVVQYFLVPVLKTVGITAPPQTAGINGGLSIFNWFVSMTGASLVERFGRRPLFLTSIIGMLCSFVMITGLAGGYNTTQNQATGVAMVPFIFVFMGFYSLAFTPLPMLYTPEISPLSMRAKAAALLLLSQNISQSFNQFCNPVALSAIGWKYYFVYIGVLSTYLALFWFFIRETKGLTTEEAAVVYEDSSIKEDAARRERELLEQAAGTLDNESEKGEKGEEEVHKRV